MSDFCSIYLFISCVNTEVSHSTSPPFFFHNPLVCCWRQIHIANHSVRDTKWAFWFHEWCKFTSTFLRRKRVWPLATFLLLSWLFLQCPHLHFTKTSTTTCLIVAYLILRYKMLHIHTFIVAAVGPTMKLGQRAPQRWMSKWGLMRWKTDRSFVLTACVHTFPFAITHTHTWMTNSPFCVTLLTRLDAGYWLWMQ